MPAMLISRDRGHSRCRDGVEGELRAASRVRRPVMKRHSREAIAFRHWDPLSTIAVGCGE